MTDLRPNVPADDVTALSARLSATQTGRVTPKSPTEALQPEPVPPPPPRSRAVRHPVVVFLNFVITMVVVGAVVIGGALFIGKCQVRAAEQPRTGAHHHRAEAAPTCVPSPTSCRENGAISSKWLFIAGVWLNKQQANLKAGEYLIPAHASMAEHHGLHGRRAGASSIRSPSPKA